MKRFYQFLNKHKKAVALAVGLLAVGSLFRWEDKQVTDAQTGRQVAAYRGIAFPWQPWDRGSIHQLPKGTTINFHVRHWLLYGLLKIEATGQTVVI
jgi:hypothetical protein